MQLLIDTDAFCKLGVTNLLDDSLAALGVALRESARLPALPYMLRRGHLVRLYGVEACARLISVAESIPAISPLDSPAFFELALLPNIDVGEAQIYAAALESASRVVSGDKRALRTLKSIGSITLKLAGRVIVLESLLLRLCTRLGSDTVRARITPIIGIDKMLGICFASANSNPCIGLLSYFSSLQEEVLPLQLWNPENEGAV